MFTKTASIRYLWKEMVVRPNIITEQKEPERRLEFQLDWVKTREEVGRIMHEFQTNNVGAFNKRPAHAEDFSLVLQKLSQTQANRKRSLNETRIVSDALQGFHTACTHSIDSLVAPTDALLAISRLMIEPTHSNHSTAAHSVTTLLSFIESRTVLTTPEITNVLTSLRLLGMTQIEVSARNSSKALMCVLEMCLTEENIKMLSPVDVAAVFSGISMLSRTTEHGTHELVERCARIVSLVGDHSVQRLAGVFTPVQLTEVLQAMVVTGIYHSGLADVLCERVLQPHILDALTGNQAAIVCYAVGSLAGVTEQHKIYQIEPGNYTHARLPSTGMNVLLPKLADARSAYQNKDWSAEQNFHPLRESDVLRESVWTVPQLLHHKVLRSVVADRKRISRQCCALLLKGNALGKYYHPERSEALQHILLSKVGDEVDAETAIFSPMKGVHDILLDARLPEWQDAYLSFDWVQQEKQPVRHTLLPLAAAAATPLLAANSTTYLWSNDNACLYDAPDGLGSTQRFGVGRDAAPSLGVKNADFRASQRSLRKDPRKRRIPKSVETVSNEVASEAVEVVDTEGVVQCVHTLLSAQYGKADVWKTEGEVCLKRWDSPHEVKCSAAFFITGCAAPVVVYVSTRSDGVRLVGGASDTSQTLFTPESTIAATRSALQDEVYLVCIDGIEHTSLTEMQRRKYVATQLASLELPTSFANGAVNA